MGETHGRKAFNRNPQLGVVSDYVLMEPNLQIGECTESMSEIQITHYFSSLIILAMSTDYQIEDQFATHFITPTIVDWVDVFTRKAYRDIVMDSLSYCIKHKGLILYGYVIMTNHLHLLVRSEPGKLSDTIRDFKKFTATALLEAIRNGPESRREWILPRFEWNAAQNKRSTDNQVWTHENRPEYIYSKKFFDQKLKYIHENPVRAGIVEQPEEYLYSSAKALLLNKPGPMPLADWYS